MPFLQEEAHFVETIKRDIKYQDILNGLVDEVVIKICSELDSGLTLLDAFDGCEVLSELCKRVELRKGYMECLQGLQVDYQTSTCETALDVNDLQDLEKLL